jgi:hypothetical protein
MSADQQTDKLKGHVLVFSEECRYLIQSFQMLLPIAEDNELLKRNRLVKHRVDGPDGGSGYCGRNFPLTQRCIHLSKRAGQIRALMVGKMSVIRSFRAAATTSDFVQAIGDQIE